ncbi:MAG: double zinc ribbon domain-containing protein [Schwartzia sp. (in: firmicutes)]
MMKGCPKCGRHYEEEHHFCGNCGSALEPLVTEYRVCPACQLYYEKEHLFCGECGTGLEEKRAAAE